MFKGRLTIPFGGFDILMFSKSNMAKSSPNWPAAAAAAAAFTLEYMLFNSIMYYF